MRAARYGAWTLLAAGLLAGMAGDRTTLGVARYRDELILAADLHVHSFPGDGSLAPWDLSREAERRGLDVIALTNHNNMIGWRLAAALPWAADGALIIPGEELTAVGHHMAAIGLTETVDWRQSAASAARAIRDRGGAAIAAHPVGREAKAFDDQAVRELDGYEAAHPLMFGYEEGRSDLRAFERRARALKPSIAAIGSTDFHFFAPLGFCRTFVFAQERSVDAVISAIRHGRTVACDTEGQTYGPADLSAIVAQACRASAGSPPRDSSRLDRAGTIGVWIALVTLVLCRPDEAG